MRIVDTDDLFSMEVINLCGGTRLGCICGLELNVAQGEPTVAFLRVPAEADVCSLLPFSKRDVYRIPWCRVECVGEDTVLVRMTQAELADCRSRQQKRRGRS